MDKAEFLELYAALAAMPEAENPALYERSRRCFDRVHKLRGEGWVSQIKTGEFFPPPIEQCPDCKPPELCYAHELVALVNEYGNRRA